MRLFDPFLYAKLHTVIILLMTVICTITLYQKSAKSLLYERRNPFWIELYSLAFIIVVGLRPISNAFGDTVNYASIYNDMIGTVIDIRSSQDRLFTFLMWFCAQRFPIESFFLFVEFCYIAPMVLACRRLMNNNYSIALLVCFAAFSFFTYSVNGLRSGMASSLILLAITYIQGNIKEKLLCALLSAMAISIHGSTALPALCMLIAFLVKAPKTMFIFWGASIILSLLAGGPISSFFANLGFDERLSDYINADSDESMFSHTGFRWDFLLYSAVPIVFGYFLIFKKKVYDWTYLLLLGTYIYANAFWIMVIRAEYSNRFAYLSWFLYPIVLIYPLLKLEIWPKTQGRKTAIIMMGHLAFTLLMTFIF